MDSHPTIPDVYGPGTYTDAAFTPLPVDCQRILKFLANTTPGFTKGSAVLNDVEFYGDDLPVIPGPIKAQALSAVCHAMMGIVGKEISALRGVDSGKIRIDVDKCGLYPATAALPEIDGKDFVEWLKDGTAYKAGLNVDKGVISKSNMRYRSWAIYPTKNDKVWYQVLGNLDPLGFLKAYDINADITTSSRDEAYEIIKREMVKYSAAELDQKNLENGFCGQTCYTPAQWRKTAMGKSLRAHPLFNYKAQSGFPDLPPIPFPQHEDKRPLAGVRVVELTRIIAGPAIGASLAALGAEVIHIQSPNLPNLQVLSVSMTTDQPSVALDINVAEDRAKLRNLIEDADVFIQGFRLGSLERKGFSLNDILTMANKRGKGIVHIDLNCYGPDGYYAERPGFQQIADAASGCSYVCGKACGFEEGKSVLPSLPIADMLSGAVGAVSVMLGLRDRAIHGGSYHANVALTAVDAIQLEEQFGLYPPETVQKIQDRFQFDPMTPDLHVIDLLALVMAGWKKNSDLLTRENYRVNFPQSPWGKNHSILSPIVQYENEAVNPYWSRGPVPYCSQTELTWAN